MNRITWLGSAEVSIRNGERFTMTQIAAQCWTIRDLLKKPEDLEPTFKKLNAIGYEAVEVGGFIGVPLTELRPVLDACGLIATGMHIDVDGAAA
ncbi:MAG: hypothetical protein IIC32_00765, partial [Chloroflexi bacterium]|nr:hypothetical protein [Chloroflexota bacterium]